MANNPEKKFRAGGCSAAIFVNQFQTPTGMKAARNVVLERTFKDKDGQFQSSKSFSMNDIPKAILVLQQAYQHIVEHGPAPEPGSVPDQQRDLSWEPSQP